MGLKRERDRGGGLSFTTVLNAEEEQRLETNKVQRESVE
jgi:hypothetical protein